MNPFINDINTYVQRCVTERRKADYLNDNYSIDSIRQNNIVVNFLYSKQLLDENVADANISEDLKNHLQSEYVKNVKKVIKYFSNMNQGILLLSNEEKEDLVNTIIIPMLTK